MNEDLVKRVEKLEVCLDVIVTQFRILGFVLKPCHEHVKDAVERSEQAITNIASDAVKK